MIEIYHRSVKEKKMEKINEYKVGSWINVYDPSEEDVLWLENTLGMDRGLLDDALDENEMPRLEKDGKIVYVYTRAPLLREGAIFTYPLLVAVGQGFVLTLSREQFKFFDKFKNAKNVFTTQRAKFLFNIFLEINNRYNNLLVSINKRVRGIKVRLEKINTKDIIQFVDIEKILNDFISALVPMNSYFEKLSSGKYIPLYEEDKDLFEDIYLGNGQLIEVSRSILKHAINIRDAYYNIMTHDLNRVMKALTVLTVLLTIPTMVFSFYGMNVPLPYDSTSQSYFGILIFTFVLLVLAFVVFVRKRWL